MIIDFTKYLENKKVGEAAAAAAFHAERLRREHLEQFLSDILLELQAA